MPSLTTQKPGSAHEMVVGPLAGLGTASTTVPPVHEAPLYCHASPVCPIASQNPGVGQLMPWRRGAPIVPPQSTATRSTRTLPRKPTSRGKIAVPYRRPPAHRRTTAKPEASMSARSIPTTVWVRWSCRTWRWCKTRPTRQAPPRRSSIRPGDGMGRRCSRGGWARMHGIRRPEPGAPPMTRTRPR